MLKKIVNRLIMGYIAFMAFCLVLPMLLGIVILPFVAPTAVYLLTGGNTIATGIMAGLMAFTVYQIWTMLGD